MTNRGQLNNLRSIPVTNPQPALRATPKLSVVQIIYLSLITPTIEYRAVTVTVTVAPLLLISTNSTVKYLIIFVDRDNHIADVFLISNLALKFSSRKFLLVYTHGNSSKKITIVVTDGENPDKSHISG